MTGPQGPFGPEDLPGSVSTSPAASTEIVGVSETGRPVGEKHWRATLTDQDVENIRQLYEEHGLSLRKIAEKFDIGRSTVWSIVTYRRRATAPVGWKRVTLVKRAVMETTRLVEGEVVTRYTPVRLPDQEKDND